MRKVILTQNDLFNLIDYNESTGDCCWRVRTLDYVVENKARTKEQELKRINSLIAGAKIGSYNTKCIGDGIAVILLGKRYKLHRIIWFYKTGSWPVGEIDHIDGNPLNNAWENLRCVTHAENMRNLRQNIRNKSGFKGVSFCKRSKKFRAQISIKGKIKYIGTYATAEEASIAYVEKAKNLGFSNRHIGENEE